MSKRILFESSAFEDFNQWAVLDKKIYKKIVRLIKDIDRSPFIGLGKPEALKHDWKGYWSRRITEEHRLVYKVPGTEAMIAACKYHYYWVTHQLLCHYSGGAGGHKAGDGDSRFLQNSFFVLQLRYRLILETADVTHSLLEKIPSKSRLGRRISGNLGAASSCADNGHFAIGH